MFGQSLPPEVLGPIKEVFFQECEELLSALETGLESLKQGSTDPETVNMVFRAVHSIKGGAANFEFLPLAQFSHVFEAVLSDFRSGSLAACPALFEDLLCAADALRELVAEAKGGGPPPNTEGVLAALAAYAHPKDGAASPIVDHDTAFHAQKPQERAWRIEFRAEPSLYRNANDPVPLFRELGRLGDLHVELDDRALPGLPELRPDNTYLSWSCILRTPLSEQNIWNVFEFVVGEDCRLDILPCTIDPVKGPFADSPRTGEAVFTPRPGHPQQNRVIRVDLDRVDRLFNLVEELLVQQTTFNHIAGDNLIPDALPVYAEFRRLSHEIQEGLLAIRSQSLKPVFQRMGGLVRQLERTTGKAVKFTTIGGESEIDRSVLERLAEPLTHLIRNAIDHGLEPAHERERAGKPLAGSITLSAYHRFGRIVIEVADDGRGIDRDRIVATAISHGLVGANEYLSEQEIDALIFRPGFSTASDVSEISGRGVGMDVVNKCVRALGGRISVSSRKGVGTTFLLSLPLTLTLLEGMTVKAGDGYFIVPIASLRETIQLGSQDVKLFGSDKVIRYGDDFIPLVSLAAVLGYRGVGDTPGPIGMVIEDDLGERVVVAVDDILGQQQIVVKEIQGGMRADHGVSAATILGDGQVALIVDINGIVERLKPGAMRATNRSEAEGKRAIC